MLKRIGSAGVGIAILLGVYFLKNDVVFNLAAVIVAIMGLNEFYHAIRKSGLKPIEWPGYLCCLLIGLVRICEQ